MILVLPLLAVFLALAVPAAAQQASQAQRNAIRQACPADYQRVCTAVPAGGKASFDCLVRNMAILSPACQRAVKSVSAGGAATRAAPAPSAAATGSAPSAAEAPAGAAAMSPREQMAVLRQSCAGDYRTLCRGVPLGGGRAIACLQANAASLSPHCSGALSAARRRR
ncbi:MAG: hypothetical protein ACREE9_14205 [Stellaceae bacterium]